MLKRVALAVLLAAALPAGAFASPLVLTGFHGPITITPPTHTVINKGTVTGGSSPGITVTGTTSTTIVNKGTISGSTGITVSGTTGSVTIVNHGTITGGIKIGG